MLFLSRRILKLSLTTMPILMLMGARLTASLWRLVSLLSNAEMGLLLGAYNGHLVLVRPRALQLGLLHAISRFFLEYNYHSGCSNGLKSL
ncbi:uncharacterized protein BYT42DRAFT_391443 [Radiomyces spectabilis]|uniref:uncharacterized protein n=1 Tax=Radiomyces spectabilis TaxID=64574 RepID=UPI00221E90B5|nr:uncharacterized protein BYT42DRAFT_391443 [Radiomyces spectabilis]KAI8376573.1 hypothetical protein BYT42DRAFT_391443 [Radiomyces spectabilis]